MRETGEKMRKSRKIPPHDFIIAKKPTVQDLFGAYIVLNYKQKYKNILNTHLYMKGKMVKCKKWVNRKSKGAKNHKCRKQFSQGTKILHLAQFFRRLHFACLFCSSFLMISNLQY